MLPLLFFQGFQGRRHLNDSLCSLFQAGQDPVQGSKLPLDWDIHSLRNGHTFDLGRMEKLLPGSTGGPFPRAREDTGPQSWARNAFTEPTLPSAPGYKIPDLTVRAEFPIFPWDKMPLQDPGNAGKQNPRRLQVLQTSPEWSLLSHLDPGAGKSMDNSVKGPHSTAEPFSRDSFR